MHESPENGASATLVEPQSFIEIGKGVLTMTPVLEDHETVVREIEAVLSGQHDAAFVRLTGLVPPDTQYALFVDPDEIVSVREVVPQVLAGGEPEAPERRVVRPGG